MTEIQTGSCTVIFNNMKMQTCMEKSVFLYEVTVYKVSKKSSNDANLRALSEVDHRSITKPFYYFEKKKLVNSYKRGSLTWTRLKVIAGDMPVVKRIESEEAAKLPQQRKSNQEKINEVFAYIYDKDYEFDLSDINFDDETEYVVRYDVYYDINKKIQTFYSDKFVYNSDDEYLELSDNKKKDGHAATSWWAITLYSLAGVFCVLLICALCRN
ncbi:hypothetical protein NUSPORA_00886 [Nucleospora cyclopteri]